jgi:hypothetical protein
MVDIADRGEPVGERGYSISVANQDVSSNHLERAIREVSSTSEVVEHLLETPVSPCDGIVSGNGPGDVRSEKLLEGSARAAGVELILRPVQPVEKGDGLISVHRQRRCARSNDLRAPDGP